MSKASNLKSYLNNTPLVQQLKSHAKALALSSAMILGIEQVSAQAPSNPHVDIVKKTTGEIIFIFKEQAGYPINFNGSGSQTGLTLYESPGVAMAAANGAAPISSGMSNPTVLKHVITDNDDIGVDSRGYEFILPDGDHTIQFDGQTSAGYKSISVSFSLINGEMKVNRIDDSGGISHPNLRDNRPQIGTPTLVPTNDAIQVPVTADAPTSVIAANNAFATGNLSTYFPSRSGGPGALSSVDSYANTISIVATQDNGFIIQDGSTVVANMNAQLNLGAGGSSSVQLNVPLGCNVTIDSIKTSHGYNSAGNPNNNNIYRDGTVGTGIGVTAVAGVGPILPNPNAPTINASTVTYSVPNIPAGFTPVGTLGGINGTWNSSTNEMTFVNVPVGNNNGTISLGSCSTSINATITNTEVAPFMGNVPDQTYTNGVAITNLDISTYISLTNGDPILSYNLSGTLPIGLVFNSSNGILSGTPTQNGTFNLSITATDNDGVSNSDNFSITVNAPEVAPIMNNIPDQSGTVGQSFNLDVSTYVTATNGDPIISYAIASGSLPAGLTLNTSTGVISGTPTTANTCNVTITATDNDGISNADAIQFTISAAEVAPIMNDIPNQSGTVGQAFNLDISPYVTATNGDAIISYAIASGSLPAGLSLNTSTGVISGTPTTANTYSVEITATDNDGVSNTDEVRFTIAPAQIVPIMGDIPNQGGLVGQVFNLDVSPYVTATNGDPIISYAIASGSLPAGLTLNTSTGIISGTPTTIGTYNVTITATDNDGASNADAVQFIIDDDSGIEEINTLDINIYPNPTTEYLSITTPDNVPTVSYEIYDMNKRLVDMGDYSNGDHIDVSRFESGVYIIQCTDTSNSQHTAIQRFIKN